MALWNLMKTLTDLLLDLGWPRFPVLWMVFFMEETWEHVYVQRQQGVNTNSEWITSCDDIWFLNHHNPRTQRQLVTTHSGGQHANHSTMTHIMIIKIHHTKSGLVVTFYHDDFYQNTHNKRSITHLWGQVVWCLLWVQDLNPASIRKWHLTV